MTIYYENPDTWEQVKVGDQVTIFKAVAGSDKLRLIMQEAKNHATRLDCYLDYFSPVPYDTVVYNFYKLANYQQEGGGIPVQSKERPAVHVGEKYNTGNVIENCKALSGNTTRVDFDDLNADEDY